ncbi:MAG: glycosyltransferase [Pararhodobacter sp.]
MPSSTRLRGAALRRFMGNQAWFDPRWYLERYPHVAASGWHPADHYLAVGIWEGYAAGPMDGAPRPPAQRNDMALVSHLTDKKKELAARSEALARIHGLRMKLLGIGFTSGPLAELVALSTAETSAPEERVLAAHELALWHMRARTAEGYEEALSWLARVNELAGTTIPAPFRQRLRVAQLLCLHHLGRQQQAFDLYEQTAGAGEVDDDVMLARATLEDDPVNRLAWINAVLAQHRIPTLTLSAGNTSLSPYDRLGCAYPLPNAPDGPRVTVLVAAYEAAETLPTALRALQVQTWRNLEILVLDDCSPSPATARVAAGFAADDPRIRLLRMPVNGGAYVARNRGLAEATGTFVTLHDADDWAHPQRIELQMRHLLDNPHQIGCLTLQARVRSDLRFTRWTGDGHFIIPNTSSFLFRKEPVQHGFGGWDRVRISADNELIRRIRHVHGRNAVTQLEGAPLAFQRDSDTSVVADEFLGINGFLYGARRAYAEAQTYHRARAATLHYSGTTRPFPVPALMRADRPAPGRHLPVVLGSEFRMQGGSVNSCIEEMRLHRNRGVPLGLVEMFRYDLYESGMRANMLSDVRALIDGETVQQIVYGEHVRCDLLVLRYPPCLWHDQRYLPRIEAREIKVIVNQPPMSDYGPDGVIRYDIAQCAANIRRWFGRDATWHPIGPLVREALHRHHADALRHVTLSPQDWHNIIDIDEWQAPPPSAARSGRLRIGRHARDHLHKWPDNAADILAAYPEAHDIEVHVLGGANAARQHLGTLPANWVVHPFGAIPPREFLAGIDVWIYFAHPDWIESFGRTIIEAMAVGVPVILPETYRAVFEDAALYATPSTAVDLARRIHANPAKRQALVAHARRFVKQRFSHESHLDRLATAGVDISVER